MTDDAFFDQFAPSDTATIDLDDVDRALIQHLAKDGRSSFAALGEKVGLTRSTARLRVHRLMDSGVLTVLGVVDPPSIGLGVWSLAYCRVDPPAAAAAALQIADADEATFVVQTVGFCDLIVELRCRDLPHLAEALDVVRGVPGIGTVETAEVLRSTKRRWLPGGRNDQPPRSQPADLDDIDRSLLDALQRDGRASFSDLATHVGLSVSAARDRVNRLLTERIVEVAAIPGLEAIATRRYLGVLLTVAGSTTPVLDAVVEVPGTMSVLETSGRHQVALESWAADTTQLTTMLGRLRSVEGVVAVDTMMFVEGVRFFDYRRTQME